MRNEAFESKLLETLSFLRREIGGEGTKSRCGDDSLIIYL